ncbi:MAG: multidrug efflux MFS transporter [Frankiaceae bacterium]|nr:multidrug efflux MFS transporter [Frankiaceae bacterium]MBV9872905.1 multidrug efflux MFS transporter [Frankiaceae bacterium]
MLADRLNPKIAVCVVYVSALFMAIIDITIVNVAIPQLARDFSVTPDHIDLVVVAFLVTLAVFIPASGWFGDRFGMKNVLLAALLIFTGASALCGISQSLTQLVIFRALQGVGGGILTPVGMAMLFRTFPPEERVRVSRILIVPTAFAPALGPVLGGFLVTDVSWRWVFYINLPIGLAAFVFGVLFLRDQRDHEAGRFDLGGFLLAGTGLPSLMYAVTEGPNRGWSSPLIIVLGLVGLALLTVFVRYELRYPEPMIDVRLIKNTLFRLATSVLFIGIAGFLGSLYLASLFFQDGLGLSARDSGLTTFPEAIGVMIGAQFATRLYANFGPRRVMTVGLFCVAASIGSFTLVGFDTNLWVVRTIMFCLGLSVSHVFVPAQAAAFATITPAAMGRASTIFNTGRQLGSAVGVAVLTTVISAVGVFHDVGGHRAPNLAAFHWAFGAGAIFALVAATIAWQINDADAASTMKPKKKAAAQEPELAPAI